MPELCPVAASEPRRRPFTADARRIAPKRRFCRACHRDKTGASFSPGEARCRKCVRDEVEVSDPKPVSRRRLCACCAVERGPACFERIGTATAEVCDLCTSNPEIRVTLRQVDAAAIVLRTLRQIAAARLDESPGCPSLGVEGLRALAAEALRTIEAAR